VTDYRAKNGGKGKIAARGDSRPHWGARTRSGIFEFLKNIRCDCVDNSLRWDIAKTTQLWQTLLDSIQMLPAASVTTNDMALAAQAVIADAGKDKQIFVGGIDGNDTCHPGLAGRQMVATARTLPSCHAWAMVAVLCSHRWPRQARNDSPSLFWQTVPSSCQRLTRTTLQRYAFGSQGYGLDRPRSNLDGNQLSSDPLLNPY